MAVVTASRKAATTAGLMAVRLVTEMADLSAEAWAGSRAPPRAVKKACLLAAKLEQNLADNLAEHLVADLVDYLAEMWDENSAGPKDLHLVERWEVSLAASLADLSADWSVAPLETAQVG